MLPLNTQLMTSNPYAPFFLFVIGFLVLGSLYIGYFVYQAEKQEKQKKKDEALAQFKDRVELKVIDSSSSEETKKESESY